MTEQPFHASALRGAVDLSAHGPSRRRRGQRRPRRHSPRRAGGRQRARTLRTRRPGHRRELLGGRQRLRLGAGRPRAVVSAAPGVRLLPRHRPSRSLPRTAGASRSSPSTSTRTRGCCAPSRSSPCRSPSASSRGSRSRCSPASRASRRSARSSTSLLKAGRPARRHGPGRRRRPESRGGRGGASSRPRRASCTRRPTTPSSAGPRCCGRGYGKALKENPRLGRRAGAGPCRPHAAHRGADLQQAREAAAADLGDIDAQTWSPTPTCSVGTSRTPSRGSSTSSARRAARTGLRTHLLDLFSVVGVHDERVRKARTSLMSALF